MRSIQARQSFTRTTLIAALAGVASLGVSSCGGAPDAVEVVSGAIVAQQTYLVSFAGGDIPSNADSIVAAAGGSIVTRYQNVGAVLARGSTAR